MGAVGGGIETTSSRKLLLNSTRIRSRYYLLTHEEIDISHNGKSLLSWALGPVL